VYVVAEVLALPAVPLTASAGYLFGVVPGTAIVLLAAATAASVSFLIGRTIGRDWILKVASGNDRFNALDKVGDATATQAAVRGRSSVVRSRGGRERERDQRSRSSRRGQRGAARRLTPFRTRAHTHGSLAID